MHLDDDWLDLDDEEYIGDKGALDESTANEGDPLDVAQAEPELDNDITTATVTTQQTPTEQQQPSTLPSPPLTSTSTLLATSIQPTAFEPIEFSSDSTPLQYFQEIFGDNTFEYIAEQTNLYAEQNPPGDSYNWKPTCAEEIKLLIGMLLTMGIHRLPSVPDY